MLFEQLLKNQLFMSLISLTFLVILIKALFTKRKKIKSHTELNLECLLFNLIILKIVHFHIQN